MWQSEMPLSAPGSAVFVIEPLPLARAGLERGLREAGHVLVGGAGSAFAALDDPALAEANLVVTDARLPDLPVAELVEQLAGSAPNARVVVLADLPNPDELGLLLRHGIVGYLPKSLGVECLCRTISTIVGESVVVLAEPAMKGLAVHVESPLTLRERQILSALLGNRSRAQIARHIGVSESTVRFHITNLYRKIDARRRTDVLFKWRLGELAEFGFPPGLPTPDDALRPQPAPAVHAS